jgi:hypothetical protein
MAATAASSSVNLGEWKKIRTAGQGSGKGRAVKGTAIADSAETA